MFNDWRILFEKSSTLCHVFMKNIRKLGLEIAQCQPRNTPAGEVINGMSNL
jgi:hypothetical protein